MSYEMKTNIANKSNYGNRRALSNIKYIVIHYTANDGDSDENNGKYFNGANRNASAHYFVDNNSITQSVPDNYVAWHCGGKKYSNCNKTGGGKYHGKCTNANSIGIELCDNVKNGIIKAGQETVDNAIQLTRMLMKKYNIPSSNVIRHFDVSGKLCPAYWCGTEKKNNLWLNDFKNKLLVETNTLPSYCFTPDSQVDEYRKIGQIHSNNFTGISIPISGIRDELTKKQSIRVLQQALNLDYNLSLELNGELDNSTIKSLGNHYVKNGETQYMVSALIILLLLKGYPIPLDSNPSKFSDLLEILVKYYQSVNGLAITGKADTDTFLTLVN